jgi:murein DD-endopeptidase MepM/ murein hydrolase activator NlpD
MTHFLQRSALILLATTALSASGLGAGPALAKVHHRGHAAARSDATTYTVRKGDTLEKIADQLGTSIEELQRLNRLKKTSVLRPGQRLKGPPAEKSAASGKAAKASGSRAETARKTYTVVHGDTLFSISKRLGVGMDDLRAANGLSGRAQIHAGQTLKLPGAAGADQADEAAVSEAAPARGAKGRRGSRISPAEVADDTATSHGGRVVTVQARGETYKAKKGDTLAKIAGRLGTDVAELKRVNHIRGKGVRAGQVYRGPSFAEHVYTAQPGDTLASIAQRFGVSVASLRAENELSKRVASVRPGQKVYLPDGYRDSSAPAPERPSRSYPPPYQPSRGDSGALPSQPQPYQPSGPTPRPYAPTPGTAPQAAPGAAPAPSDAQITQLAKGRFQWPAHGDILSDFGPRPGGQRNDGINIQAEAGSPVRAAADGEVVYAGDQVPGFGNLVLIKHADGWATAYGHLGRVDVKNQQKITQGQQIGQAGTSGGVPEPQVHFEVRYGAHAVDPKLVLPK